MLWLDMSGFCTFDNSQFILIVSVPVRSIFCTTAPMIHILLRASEFVLSSLGEVFHLLIFKFIWKTLRFKFSFKEKLTIISAPENSWGSSLLHEQSERKVFKGVYMGSQNAAERRKYTGNSKSLVTFTKTLLMQHSGVSSYRPGGQLLPSLLFRGVIFQKKVAGQILNRHDFSASFTSFPE